MDAMNHDAESLVNELDAVDKQILALKRTNPRISLSQVGSIIGVHKTTVHNRINKDKFKRIWDALEKDIFTRLKELHSDCIIVFQKALRDPDIKIALKAAESLMRVPLESHHMMPETDEALEELEFII